jgi:hypothetical protein
MEQNCRHLSEWPNKTYFQAIKRMLQLGTFFERDLIKSKAHLIA